MAARFIQIRDRPLLRGHQSDDRHPPGHLLASVLEVRRSHLPHGKRERKQRKKTANERRYFYATQAITGYGLWDYAPLEYEGYVYPMWANVLGWCIAGSSIAMIPAVAVYKLATTPGSLCQVRFNSRYV